MRKFFYLSSILFLISAIISCEKEQIIAIENITLSESAVELEVPETLKVEAVITPANKASEITLTWSSSNKSVATVDDNGIITAKYPGKTTITASYENISASISVTVTNTHNGYEYVNLGLPSGTKWANYNIGATVPYEYGDYFAWGETETKETYTRSNSSTFGKEIGDISGNPEYDAARAIWGKEWRLPTFEEIRELEEYCTINETTVGGIDGVRVTGPSGQSIFLPYSGRKASSETIHQIGTMGIYWSSLDLNINFAASIGLGDAFSTLTVTNDGYKYEGCSIRPVWK
ncbi:MAG: Ig-like domain-containing protein [Bacteroidales bacterium]|nr:Ig-like domain-containing protein [Bacteroidales bacterium]